MALTQQVWLVHFIKIVEKRHLALAFEALEKGIISGEFPYVKLFMEYRFGKPKDSLDITSKGESVKSISPIEWVRDATDQE